ncbi:MAG TPA: radical SAM protein [Xanthobacteraceae bacterium]|nr:radical SAM protein [Xanthobacteraceae bacterium]
MARRGAGELTTGRIVSQLFRVRADHLRVIEIIIGTHWGRQSGRFEVSVFDFGLRPPRGLTDFLMALDRSLFDPGSQPSLLRDIRLRFGQWRMLPVGRRIACQIVELATIYDNASVSIHLDAPEDTAGRHFLVRIAPLASQTGNAATVWLGDGDDAIEGHIACLVGGSDQGAMGVVATLGFDDPIAATPVPPGLLLSPTSQCNLNCIHCISSFSRKSVRRLAPEIRQQLQEWASEGWLRSVASDYSGDILWSDQRFGGDLDLLLDLDLPFHLDTNGIALTEDYGRRLLSSKVRSINVSLDAARDGTFRRIRRGAPALQSVLEKLKMLARQRADIGRTDIQLSISMSLMKSNAEEIFAAIDNVKEIGFDAIYSDHVEIYDAKLEKESFWFDQAGFNDLRQRAILHAQMRGVPLGIPPPFEDKPERFGHTYCRDPWDTAVILGNGDVRACCIPAAELTMGNLHENSMEEIWNGERYMDLRRRVNTPDAPGACRHCPRRRIGNNPGSYLPFRYVEDLLGR